MPTTRQRKPKPAAEPRLSRTRRPDQLPVADWQAALRRERDPVTGQPSLRLPLPDPALLQRLAQALSPWLRP